MVLVPQEQHQHTRRALESQVVVVHAFSPSTQEAETGGSLV